MSDQIESNESGDVDAESGILSRRRALGLGAVVAGGVWVAPAMLSFDAASAETSGVGPTAAPGTITASVTGSVPGVTNPAPVTVTVGQPIYLQFTAADPSTLYEIYYETVDGTAKASTNYWQKNGWLQIGGRNDGMIDVDTITTSLGPNTSFTVSLVTYNTRPWVDDYPWWYY